MKKVFLYAYDGTNLGDDLFVRVICGRYPQAQFYIWGDEKRREVFRDVPNLKVILRDNPVSKVLGAIRPSFAARYHGWLEHRCDAVVYIGGSIFMEYPNWEMLCTWWDYEAKNRPFYVLGANFGPWHTEAYREKMAEIFANCRDVCFRDRYSAELFPGVTRCAPDILLGYPMKKVSVKKKQLFVSVIDCAGRDEAHSLTQFDGNYVANMARLLKSYLVEGWHIVLSSFCKREGDENGIRKVLDAMGVAAEEPRISLLCYDGTNTEALLIAIAESERVIATRFHGVILALTVGRPVLPVVYSDKTLRVLEDLEFDGAVVDLRDEASWESAQNWENHTPLSDVVRHAAERHFEKVDTVIGREQ